MTPEETIKLFNALVRGRQVELSCDRITATRNVARKNPEAYSVYRWALEERGVKTSTARYSAEDIAVFARAVRMHMASGLSRPAALAKIKRSSPHVWSAYSRSMYGE